MNQDQYKSWVGSLAELTQVQLSDLQARIKILSTTAEKEHNGKSDFSMRVLQAICDTMKKHGVETPSPHVLKKTTAYVQSTGKMQDLSTWFDTISKNKLIQDGILKIALDLMYFDLLNWKRSTISSHTMIRHVHRIPSIINKHFPGYSQSGLLLALVHNGT